MPLEAVVCLECGYNQSLGRRMETKRVRTEMRGNKGYLWILAAVAFNAFLIWLAGPVVLCPVAWRAVLPWQQPLSIR